MNFNTLRYLVVLAQERSFARAAKKLFVVQPTLRQAISALEHDLGTQLYVRGASPLTLTPAGSLYVKWARETLQTHSDTVQQVADLTHGSTQLTLALTYSLSMIYSSRLAQAFHAARPQCRLTLQERNSTNAQRELESSGTFDIMLGTPMDPPPILQVEDVATETMMLALPRSHPRCPAPGRELDPAILKELPLIRLSNSLNHDMLVDSLAGTLGFSPETAMASNGYNTIVNMVGAGLGFALVPAPFLRWRDAPNVAVFPVPGLHTQRILQLAWRKDRYFTPDMACMVKLIHEIVGADTF